MARTLTLKQLVVLVIAGVAAAWLWTVLLTLWVIFDTPLLKVGFSLGFGAPVVMLVSMSLFAIVSALAFTVALRMLFPHSFPSAAAVFIVAFLAVFVLPAVFSSELAPLLASLSGVWLFVGFFALWVALIRVVRHA